MKKLKNNTAKISIVVGIDPSKYAIKDSRFLKPVCHQKIDNGLLVGSMLVQDIDTVPVENNRRATYIVPNNIALLLSTCKKSLNAAKVLFDNKLADNEIEIDYEKMPGNPKENIDGLSTLICDYLESIQTSIVFGYTALEAFANLSIPDNYKFIIDKNNKGISEIYDKNAIERWLPLKTKINNILSDIYKISNVVNQKWWNYFLKLEDYRNDIIHQKSITHTEFYKNYFKRNIFDICNSPFSIIRFFHDVHAEKNKTNPIWPWLEEGTNAFPINSAYEASNFEVVGNLYEGIKS